MKMNLKLRLQNKATLLAILIMFVAIIYEFMAIIGVNPNVDRNAIESIIRMVVDLLVLLGIVVDPTTAGIGDTSNVMNYDSPRKEEE